MAKRELDEAVQRHWLDWLAERSERDGVTGFDAIGWPAATWVLHSIYEDRADTSDVTYDQIRQARLAAGVESPLIIGSINLDERSTVVGGSLGMGARPQGRRTRLRWHNLAARLTIDFGGQPRPPSLQWFPYRSWPARLDPPDEGSLDEESLRVLVDLLANLSSDGRSERCIVYYSPLANRANFDETWMREVELGDVRSLVDPDGGRPGTPSNWWSLDQSWMIYTDWDLWATKVSGTTALIESVESDPRLECLRWPLLERSPHAAGARRCSEASRRAI